MLPSTRCQLEIRGRTITSQHKDHLRQAISRPVYMQYLQAKHEWDSTTQTLIDWEAFGMASRTYFSTEVHLTKLIHNLLPTKARVHKFQPWVSPICHFCSELETFHHLQTCHHHPGSQTFRSSTIDALNRYFSTNKIPARFRMLFIQSLQESFGIIPSSGNNSPSRESPVLDSQRRIGIHLFTRGFLSIRWRFLLHATCFLEYRDYSASQNDPNPYLRKSTSPPPAPNFDSTPVLAGMIKVLWGEMGSLWLNHLSLIHTPAPKSSSVETLANLRSHFLLLHNLQPYVSSPQRAKCFHRHPTQFVQDASEDQIRRYIHMYKPLILADIRAREPFASGSSRTTASQLIQSLLTWSPPLSGSTDPIDLSPHPAQQEASHRTRNRLRRDP